MTQRYVGQRNMTQRSPWGSWLGQWKHGFGLDLWCLQKDSPLRGCSTVEVNQFWVLGLPPTYPWFSPGQA